VLDSIITSNTLDTSTRIALYNVLDDKNNEYRQKMKKIVQTDENDRWLQALGQHVENLILEKGYKSAYEFWIQEIGDEISRATLNNIINGKFDVKATSLRKIAIALKINPKEILNFNFK
jgi:hypothetical protein